MSISYSDIEKYLQKHEDRFNLLLGELEKSLKKGKPDIPIYSMKSRIKTIDSIYLKTKRKRKKSLDDITDYAGLRVLCLFEKDILKIHKYIIENLFDKKYRLKEFEIYNWTDETDSEILLSITKEKLSTAETKSDRKPSGYKSLHYIVYVDNYHGYNYPIEIQLRTLLQDVWGELEHTLCYKKGSVHPHIKKSFSLLAKDIENNDFLLTHLKDINEKQLCAEQFFVCKRPLFFFGYDNEKDKIPDLFKRPDIAVLWQKYNDHFKGKKLKEYSGEALVKFVEDARKLYANLWGKLTAVEVEEKNVKYIKGGENAFLLFLEEKEENLDLALNLYEILLKEIDYKDYYVIHFRMGEILFIQGKIEKALIHFDECELSLSKQHKKDFLNAYRVKSRLAFTYWLLGDEYIDIVIKEINDAEKIYKKYLWNSEDTESRNNLLNNIGWYHLDKYIINNNKMAQITDKKKRKKFKLKVDKDYKTAEIKCFEIEKNLGNDPTNDMYDTLAWFYHQKYLINKDKQAQEKAKEYCSHLTGKFDFESWGIYMSHIQEIMCTQ